jgi:hypothetical protein
MMLRIFDDVNIDCSCQSVRLTPGAGRRECPRADAVRQTLSEVHMDRPLETIERRGRNRRRSRLLSGLAGGGLAVLVGAALAVPMLTGATPARSSSGLADACDHLDWFAAA